MSRRLDIGIVGAGFAGCAAGVFLARAGHAVTLYERAREPGAVGAGILLQPTGLAVLDRLGLAGQVLPRAAAVRELHCRTRGGRDLFRLAYAELAPGLGGWGVHRGALFEALWEAGLAAGVRVSPGLDVAASEQHGGRVRVRDAAGRWHGRHELLVVADGARSRLRPLCPAERRARPYPWGALWFVGRDPEDRFKGVLAQTCEGTRRMLGFLPTGLGPRGPRAGTGDEAPLVSLFWSVRMEELAAWQSRGLLAWKEEILRFEPGAEHLLGQIDDFEQLLSAGYVDAVLDRFHHGRWLFLGDAAHATSPQLGQGTNLALLDAASLADALDETDDLDEATATFTRARRAHAHHYQLMSRWLTPFFQSDVPTLGALRDVFFPLLTRPLALRRLMLRILAGTSRGFLRRPWPLPENP